MALQGQEMDLWCCLVGDPDCGGSQREAPHTPPLARSADLAGPTLPNGINLAMDLTHTRCGSLRSKRPTLCFRQWYYMTTNQYHCRKHRAGRFDLKEQFGFDTGVSLAVGLLPPTVSNMNMKSKAFELVLFSRETVCD